MKLRSLLYVPAHSERFIAKAHERGADAIILDLEDSVPEADKDAARANLATAVPSVGQAGAQVFVRVNAGPRQREDALAACRAGAGGLLIPKAASTGALESLAGTLRAEEASLARPAMSFIATIEDPAALLDARAIAGVHRVIGLCLGSEDFALAIGATPTPDVLRHPKLMLHYAAKAAGKLSLGLLRSIADYSDLTALTEAAREARLHGFDGATCVHPSAVPVLNAAFQPSDEERTWAARVIAEAAHHSGAFEFDGRMIDAPVLARARRIAEG
ncbi:CoA ester lyase [Devosia sp. ZB163]|uniref:HpcH/HpaI aldolase/citrate lyase family protein n=1 Tax=Devosia sp. ZB163 TaxID=3025938 RepID=UPI0023630339|nr:CoA ester lyase [Devosia sp. ZB163]MDC9823114.1 CoA ester lyase [Devosia sp. ZB163]